MATPELTANEKEICDLEMELSTVRKRLLEAHAKRPKEEIKNYKFEGPAGPLSLMDLFGDKDELILVHNMGKSCPYCTLWADGFNGFTAHLENRAAFALTSPDDFKNLSSFAEGRGWRFKCYSTQGTDFQKDMGFWGSMPSGDKEGPWPGLSFFYRKGDKIYRNTRAALGPGDLFCSVWHMFDLLEKGVNGWGPKYSYQ